MSDVAIRGVTEHHLPQRRCAATSAPETSQRTGDLEAGYLLGGLIRFFGAKRRLRHLHGNRRRSS